MTIDDTVKLLDGVTKLLAVLVWPAILAFVLVRFRAALGEFMTSLTELSFKGGGIEASAKRRQAEAAAALGAAAVARPDADTAPRDVSQETRVSGPPLGPRAQAAGAAAKSMLYFHTAQAMRASLLARATAALLWPRRRSRCSAQVRNRSGAGAVFVFA
jgi:hypothetical protein